MDENLFDKLNSWVNNTEGSLVNFLTAFSPWLAPLAPAYMTYGHMVDFLHFPWPIAGALALVVEILGFGTVSTFLDFWFFNRKNKAQYKQAPLGLVVISFLFYLGLIIVSNVLIDLAKAYGAEAQISAAIVSVRALLTLQTIPAAIIVAVRTGHRDLLREIQDEKFRNTSESNYGTSGSRSMNSKNTSRSRPRMGRPSVHKEKVFLYMDEILQRDGRVATFLEVQRELSLPESTASRIRNDWLSENGYDV